MEDVEMHEEGVIGGPSDDEQEIKRPDDGDPGVVSSLYPQPPRIAQRYTRDNVRRLKVLEEKVDEATRRDWDTLEPQERIKRQTAILELAQRDDEPTQEEKEKDDKNVKRPSLLPAPNFDVLLEMGKPDIDSIIKDGYYTCFGDRWPIEERLPNLEEMGMKQLYQSDVDDRRPTLQSLLRSMLKTYLSLIDHLLLPPNEYLSQNQVQAPDGTLMNQEGWRFVTQDVASEVNDIVVNIQHLLNELRPAQAREDLKDILRSQVKRRREEADLIKRQCAAMRSEVANLRREMKSEATDSIQPST